MKITRYIYFYKIPKTKSLITSSNSMVIIGRKNQIIIDPGIDLNRKWNSLIGEMKADGLDIKKTTRIWLTHSHPDHVQLIERIVKESGAKVSCHHLAKTILESKRPFLKFQAKEAKLAGKLYKLLYLHPKKINPNMLPEIKTIVKFLNLKKMKIDRVFEGGEEIVVNGLKIYILGLPGHSPDEIGFWIPKEEVLIIGDLIHPTDNGQGGRSHFPIFNTFASDIEKAKESLKKLTEIKNWSFFVLPILPKICRPRILLPAHGEPVIGKQNIQNLFEGTLANIEAAKQIAKKFVDEEYPCLDSFQLITGLAEKLGSLFPKEILTPDLEYEMQFAALAILKSMGVIK